MTICRLQNGTDFEYSEVASFCNGGQQLKYAFNTERICFVYKYNKDGKVIDDKNWDFNPNTRNTLLIGEIDEDYIVDAGDEDGLVAIWDKIVWTEAINK